MIKCGFLFLAPNGRVTLAVSALTFLSLCPNGEIKVPGGPNFPLVGDRLPSNHRASTKLSPPFSSHSLSSRRNIVQLYKISLGIDCTEVLIPHSSIPPLLCPYD